MDSCASHLLRNNRVKAKIVRNTTAAIFFRDVESDETASTGESERLSGRDAFAFPIIVIWHHVLLQEVARKRPKGVMLGTENRTFHCPNLCRFLHLQQNPPNTRLDLAHSSRGRCTR